MAIESTAVFPELAKRSQGMLECPLRRCWVGPGNTNGYSSGFFENQFVVGEQDSLRFRRLELDGISTEERVNSPSFTSFHHNLDRGKQGMLIEVNAGAGASRNLESVIGEMNLSGAVVKEWDFAALLSQYMLSQGDNPDAFIRPGIDWFSSITSDGLLMLFNNGTASLNQPVGAPVGGSRMFSAVSSYAIDTASLTAREVWRYEHDKNILSAFCSSAHEGKAKSLLVTYSNAKGSTAAIVTALDAKHQIVFEFEYASIGCDTSWNAQIIAMDDLVFE